MTNDYSAMIALSDPTRQAIFEMVAERPRSVAEMTRALPVTQSAVSQHLKVLRDAQLVQSRKEGARSIYALDRTGLERLRRWLDGMWGEALSSFAEQLEQSEKTRQ